MQISRRRTLALTLAAGATGLAPVLARAQDRRLKLLVGYAPGGTVDVVARQAGEEMRRGGADVIVENRTGAGGRLAVQQLLQGPADGSTLILMPAGNVSLFQHVYPKLPYSLADLAPVATVCSFNFALAVGPGAPVASLAEFVAWAKARPGKASYGSPGGGSVMHFMGAMFARQAGLDFQHIPYRGGAAAMNDVLGGTTPALASALPNLVEPHKAGKLRILATTGEQRSPVLPDVPTFKEQGYPELVLREVFGFFAPARTPAPTLAALEKLSTQAAATPRMQATLDKLGFDSQVTGSAAFGAYLREDLARWGPIVKATGYKADE